MITRLIAKLPAGGYFVRRGDTGHALVVLPRAALLMAGQDDSCASEYLEAASLNLIHMCDLKFRLPSLDIQVIRDRLELRSTSDGLIRTIL